MTLFELNELIENGENASVEFKRKFTSPEKIAKEMIAFANTKGGRMIFGIDDDRRVIGVESEKGEVELIDMAARFYCRPEVKCDYEIINIYRKDVVVVDIKESKTKPHSLISNGDQKTDTKVYIRIRDKSVIASKETVRVLKRSNPDAPPQIFQMGEKEKALLEYLSSHERITMKGFKQLVNISPRRASRILVNLVRAELIRLHSMEDEDFYTLS